MQNRVAQATWGVPYSSLSTDDRTRLDNGWTSGTLSGGVAYEAQIETAQLAQWLEQASSSPDTSLPEPAWDRLFTAKASMILAKTVRPDRYELLRRDHEDAIDWAVDTYTPTLITSSTIAGQNITVAGLRSYVCNLCAKRKESGANQGLRRRIFPMIADVDSHIQWSINYLWNMSPNIRKRMIEITINANNTVTMTGLSSETFDSIASNCLYYGGTSGFGEVLRWVNDTQAPMLKAHFGTTTGKPLYFRTENNSGTITWHLFPIPNAAYTCYGTVYVATPTMTTLADINTAITKFPPELRTVLRDVVLAKTLLQHGSSDGEQIWRRAIQQVESLAPTYVESGNPARVAASVLDVYGDADRLMSGGSGAFGYG